MLRAIDRLAPLLLVVLAAGCQCGDTRGNPDGAVALDAGGDAGAPPPRDDAGPPRADAGARDAGALDGGGQPGPDASAEDAGLTPDAGLTSDAGSDGGALEDAGGLTDGGPVTPCSGGSGDHLLHRGIQSGLPRIGWTGTEYAYAFFGRPTAGAASESFLGFADATGAPRGTPSPVTPVDGEASIWVRVARSDVGYGITYPDDRGAARAIYFARLTPSGAPVSGSEVVVASDGDVSAIAWDPVGRQYGVVWSEGASVHLRRFGADGAASGSSTTRVGDGGIGYTGSPVVWADDRFAIAAATPVRVIEVMGDGTAGATYELGLGGSRASLAWSGAEYGVSWQSAGEVRFARVDGAGLVAGSEVVLDAGPFAGESDVAWSGTEFGVSWDKGSAGSPSDVWFANVSASGLVSGTRRLTTSAEFDWWPSLTWCGQYAVIYEHIQAGVDEENELRIVFP